MENKRKEKALKILLEEGIDNLEFLGEGQEGVVYTDKHYVYKVILPLYSVGEFDFHKVYRNKSYFINLPNNLKSL